jgi:hypothetical protein
MFVTVKWGVLSEVRTEFLSIIWTSFSFKGLNSIKVYINLEKCVIP